jgi:methyl-accepting chemotaxis protein
MTMNGNRRKAFEATSSLQYRFLAMILVYFFVIVCFFAVAVFVPDLIEMEDQSLSLAARGDAASRLLFKNSWVWPAVLSLILILGLHSFFAFQKIMGPLYRFRCTFEELGNGNLRCNMKIRKNDYLHTEEKALDGMINSLTAKLAGLKDAAEEARTSLGRLEQAANNGKQWSEPERNLLAVHRESLDRLASEFQFFLLQEEENKQSA